MPLTASSGTTRSSGNKLIVVYCRRSWSNTDRLFRHDASCLSLISPRYRTVRCAVCPVDNRRFSTTLKYRCSLPSFFRVVLRRNIPSAQCQKPIGLEKGVGLHHNVHREPLH